MCRASKSTLLVLVDVGHYSSPLQNDIPSDTKYAHAWVACASSSLRTSAAVHVRSYRVVVVATSDVGSQQRSQQQQCMRNFMFSTQVTIRTLQGSVLAIDAGRHGGPAGAPCQGVNQRSRIFCILIIKCLDFFLRASS